MEVTFSRSPQSRQWGGGITEKVLGAANGDKWEQPHPSSCARGSSLQGQRQTLLCSNGRCYPNLGHTGGDAQCKKHHPAWWMSSCLPSSCLSSFCLPVLINLVCIA